MGMSVPFPCVVLDAWHAGLEIRPRRVIAFTGEECELPVRTCCPTVLRPPGHGRMTGAAAMPPGAASGESIRLYNAAYHCRQV